MTSGLVTGICQNNVLQHHHEMLMQKWNLARFSSQWGLRGLEEVWRYRLPLSSPEVQPLFSEEQGTRQEGVKDHHGD